MFSRLGPLLRWPPGRAHLGISAAVLLMIAATASQMLRGSRASMDRQNEIAEANDFSYLATDREIARSVMDGLLVPLVGNEDYQIHHGVSFPYARPEVRRFVQDVGYLFARACSTPMVVTSLTRPMSAQPRNASERSVHPTGMAVDLRYPGDSGCRMWMNTQLMFYERRGVIEATLESRPPHYHVAVFPRRYVSFVEGRARRDPVRRGER